jgi:hypothetical protein
MVKLALWAPPMIGVKIAIAVFWWRRQGPMLGAVNKARALATDPQNTIYTQRANRAVRHRLRRSPHWFADVISRGNVD